MEKIKKNILNYGYVLYLIVSFLLLAAFIFVIDFDVNADIIHLFMICGVFVVLFQIMRKSLSKSLTIEELVFYIVILGCIIRIGYALYNNIYVRTHDFGDYENYENAGKGAYLMWLLKRGQLPDSYAGQYYHAPFSYLASAFGSKLTWPFLKECNSFVIISAGKLAPCLASCGVLFMTPKLCKAMEIPKKTVPIITLLVAAYPGFFLISGRIGEDAFSCFFAMAEILYTIYWHEKPSIKNTIFLAIMYGLGVQTSLTCCLPAAFTVIIFLQHIISRSEKRKQCLSYILLFGIISLPLGLWYYVRNYVLFKMPFTYVMPQDVGNSLWRGDCSLWTRYKPLDIRNILHSPFANPFEDANLFTYMLKSELFGEFTYNVGLLIPYILLLINLVFSICAVGYLIFSVLKKRTEKRYIYFYIILPVYFLFIIYSYWKQPFGCSMDARYFMILTVLKILVFGMFSEKLLLSTEQNKIIYLVKKCFMAAIWVFAGLSFAMFCVIS